MEKIILVILSVLCLVSCNQSEKKNDLTEENLKGKVKSITENTYEAVDKFGQIEKGDVLVDSSAVYTDDGRFKIYNEKGNKIEENYYNSNGSLIYKNTYKYDEKGNKIEENYYNSNGRLYSKTTYKYDEKGNMIEDNFYDSDDGSLIYKNTYKYDEKGNKIEEYHYDEDGKFNYKTTYKYDEKGNKIEYNDYDSDGRLNSKTTYKYEYDKNNNWTQQVIYANNKPTQITERIIEYYP